MPVFPGFDGMPSRGLVATGRYVVLKFQRLPPYHTLAGIASRHVKTSSAWFRCCCEVVEAIELGRLKEALYVMTQMVWGGFVVLGAVATHRRIIFPLQYLASNSHNEQMEVEPSKPIFRLGDLSVYKYFLARKIQPHCISPSVPNQLSVVVLAQNTVPGF